MIASMVNFSLPSRWWASRGALMRTPTLVDDLLDQGARVAGRVDGQLRADQLDHVGARERGLVDVRCHLGDARSVECAALVCAALGARREVRVAVQVQAARVGAPLRFELGPGQRFGFGGAGRFLRGGQLRGGGLRRR